MYQPDSRNLFAARGIPQFADPQIANAFEDRNLGSELDANQHLINTASKKGNKDVRLVRNVIVTNRTVPQFFI